MKERQPPKRSAKSMPQPIISALCKDKEPSPKRICHVDHSYCKEDSPTKLRRDLQKSNAKVTALQKKIKAQQGKLRRWRLKITSLKTVVKHL